MSPGSAASFCPIYCSKTLTMEEFCMAKRIETETPAYGGNGGKKQGGRALTYNMFDREAAYDSSRRNNGGGNRSNSNGNGRREERKLPKGDLKLGVYQAWLFDLGDKERPVPELVEGVVMDVEEGTGDFLWKFNFTLPPEATGKTRPETVTEILNLTQWFKNKNRVITTEDNILLTAELPLTTHDGEPGVLLFIRPPGSGGIRLHKEPNENPPMTADELRTAHCYIENRWGKEAEREREKRALPKDQCFHFPGSDGENLMSKGVRVAYPLFKDNTARRLKKPHEHMILMQKGKVIKRGGVEIEIPTKIELMCQFRHDQKVPNWYEIQVDSQGNISVINIRDPKQPWMMAALAQLQQEQEQHSRRVEENQAGI